LVNEARAWEVLAEVLDPEVPALSLCDLGIVRDVRCTPDGGVVAVLTPTYSGCPATEVIDQSVRDALAQAGFHPVSTELRRAPAWTTDWISEAGRRKLKEYGIAPPGACGSASGSAPASVSGNMGGNVAPIRWKGHTPVACPRCDSAHTEQLSAFGSTACKSLWRCLACREPFEHFKPI
jgi:ring-1,2-phenylacetyl-CoA epoxidase subunit PaaD